jgi:hypothetical protein
MRAEGRLLQVSDPAPRKSVSVCRCSGDGHLAKTLDPASFRRWHEPSWHHTLPRQRRRYRIPRHPRYPVKAACMVFMPPGHQIWRTSGARMGVVALRHSTATKMQDT